MMLGGPPRASRGPLERAITSAAIAALMKSFIDVLILAVLAPIRIITPGRRTTQLARFPNRLFGARRPLGSAAEQPHHRDLDHALDHTRDVVDVALTFRQFG